MNKAHSLSLPLCFFSGHCIFLVKTGVLANSCCVPAARSASELLPVVHYHPVSPASCSLVISLLYLPVCPLNATSVNITCVFLVWKTNARPAHGRRVAWHDKNMGMFCMLDVGFDIFYHKLPTTTLPHHYHHPHHTTRLPLHFLDIGIWFCARLSQSKFTREQCHGRFTRQPSSMPL